MPTYFTPALTTYLLFLSALLGLIMGSFCNAWAWRLVHGESIVRGRSHCARCGHTLAPRDLIPLASFLLLRGRCRYCGEPISSRYPAAEALCAVFFLSVVWRYGFSWGTLRLLLLGCALLVLSLADWESFELPTPPLVLASLAAVLRLPAEGLSGGADALLGAAAVSLPLLLFVLLADRVAGRETMGGGDIKLFAALGLHLGPALTLMALILSCFAGLLLGLLSGRGGKGRPFPFGPAIALASWPVLLFGPALLTWYLSLFF